jgi:hypothetical protein
VASHGRVPGLVTKETARRQGAVPRSPARRAVPEPAAPDPPPGIPACVRSGCWRVRHCPEKACAVITLPLSLPAQAFALLGHTPLAVSALPAGVLTDRARMCQAANPSPAQARTGYGCPIPVMSLPSHSASRAPRSQTRPAGQPVYRCIAAVCGNARSCRRPSADRGGNALPSGPSCRRAVRVRNTGCRCRPAMSGRVPGRRGV